MVINPSVIGLWESCYPTYLEEGPIVRQHVVFYYKSELQEEMKNRFPCFNDIKIQAEETDYVAWLSSKQVLDVLNKTNEEDICKGLRLIDGEQIEVDIKLKQFMSFSGDNKNNKEKENSVEELAKGTVFILKSLYQSL